ncbi:MAG: type VI secretion system baseplate subunit TssK, partial [Pseudomonadota bacterium]
MSWQSKVMWREGLFLQPHHFQQQDRYIETLAAGLAGGIAPYAWGVQRLAIDEEMLKLGKIAVSECTGLTPDGAYFRAPAIDDLPEAMDVPDGIQNCTLYLALPTRRPGAVEIDGSGEELATRFRAAEVEITDTMGSDRRPVIVAVGKMRLQFALEVDDLADRLTIPIGRIIEKNSDGSVLMDKAFIASCIDARAAPPLHDFLNELAGVLNARLDSLAGRLGEGGGPKAAGEIQDFLYLQLVNRVLPEMRHLLGIENTHPCTLYRAFVGLAGEVATFVDPSRRPPEFAPYRHDDLTTTFQPVMRALRRYLSAETGPRATLIRLDPRKYG